MVPNPLLIEGMCNLIRIDTFTDLELFSPEFIPQVELEASEKVSATDGI